MRLGDAAYEALVAHCPGVRELRLYASMPSAKAVQGLAALRQLQVVDLCGAHAVTGTCLVANNSSADIPTYRYLSCAKGVWTPVGEVGALRPKLLQGVKCVPCVHADGAVAALAACQDLREANLTWCVQLTDKGVAALARGCHSLEVLSLHGLRGVTDASVIALAQSCAGTLRTLDTSGCLGIKEHDRAALRRLFPRLRCFVVHK